MTHTPEWTNGLTMYRNVALFEEGFKISLTRAQLSYRPNPQVLPLARVEWEEAL